MLQFLYHHTYSGNIISCFSEICMKVNFSFTYSKGCSWPVCTKITFAQCFRVKDKIKFHQNHSLTFTIKEAGKQKMVCSIYA